ncbi:uncharacterized protein L969DRAFT_90041 [Mixia osmundae IAM 14324]|uniref:DUF572-domain-containing protein n=1 Tax=Mixia osmundae (strain CBS 9802 / IAM 14324 / JCM 22182 / KY 12970) TaxID=764103 RepID=G7EAU5_MIXOS|nr:uncharacterized protein L969DRAFT_90041 [Mixia osmundae IAM 14324]KEI36989.1 hypothetical protein L969DRAFT_90041 [Mixia osmundae IAM 14324]GAA99955.1 hypothetical protein E5Q_06658 [Mixia osmundae IAM 14324]
MQGFNKYYPPDYDPSKSASLNAYHGKHALGDRARKLDQGVLITRFELPFNVWCGGCDAHIGMGVRYNAEKKRVGNYYTTSIYSFRCKCHLCGHYFEIQTDPKNARYVVTLGARQKHEEWDPEENGTIVFKEPSQAPADPFAAIEQKTTDRTRAETAATRLEALEESRAEQWADPYSQSQRLRDSFRTEKRGRQIQDARDGLVRDRFGLSDKLLLGASTKDEEEQDRNAWQRAKAQSAAAAQVSRRHQEDVLLGRELMTSPRKKRSADPQPSAARQLQRQLSRTRRKHSDPFRAALPDKFL